MHENTKMKTIDKTKPFSPAQANRRETKSADFRTMYANDIQIQTTPWDMRLTFSQMKAPMVPTSNPTLDITQISELFISPQLAKKMALIIIEQLRSYEEAMGEIPLPKE
jgi:Protein of unknown function (DUF3467)